VLGDLDSNPGSDKSSLSRPITPRPTLGPTHAPAQWVQLAVSLGFMGPEREVGLSLLSIVEVKGGYTLVTLPRIVTPYRDSVDGTRDRVTYHKLVTR